MQLIQPMRAEKYKKRKKLKTTILRGKHCARGTPHLKSTFGAYVQTPANFIVKVKVKQSPYRPAGAQRVPGS